MLAVPRFLFEVSVDAGWSGGQVTDKPDFYKLAESGQGTRREVLGDTYVDAQFENVNVFEAQFQDYIDKAAWGAIWGRPDLSRHDRSLVTIALLASQGHFELLARHINGAIRNGCSREELYELAMHVSVYVGVPCGVRLMSEVKGSENPLSGQGSQRTETKE